MSRLKFEISQLKFEMSRLKFEMSHFECRSNARARACRDAQNFALTRP
jgi:hypothetical protein